MMFLVVDDSATTRRIVINSLYRNWRERLVALAAAASDCLARPFTPEDLNGRIAQLLAHAASGER